MSVSSAIGIDPPILDQSIPAVYSATAVPTTLSVALTPIVYTITLTPSAGTYIANLNLNYTLLNSATDFDSVYAQIQVGTTNLESNTNFSVLTGGSIDKYPVSINGIIVVTAGQSLVLNVCGVSVANTNGDFEVSGVLKLIQLTS